MTAEGQARHYHLFNPRVNVAPADVDPNTFPTRTFLYSHMLRNTQRRKAGDDGGEEDMGSERSFEEKEDVEQKSEEAGEVQARIKFRWTISGELRSRGFSAGNMFTDDMMIMAVDDVQDTLEEHYGRDLKEFEKHGSDEAIGVERLQSRWSGHEEVCPICSASE